MEERMLITIVLPYEKADRLASRWAMEEGEIDFLRDGEAAARCTVSFASAELKRYLAKILRACEIFLVGPEGERRGFVIRLAEDGGPEGVCDYRILPPDGVNGELVIRGAGRAGVLYGCYHFLSMQGIRWYAPGPMGEVCPKNRETLTLLTEPLSCSPDYSFGRGFDFEGNLKESEELWYWMARNRLNIAAYRPFTAAVQRKLCMQFKNGGHIFEQILNPSRILDDGRTLWEAHPDWYGTPKDGEPPLTPDQAFTIQFCSSNKGLAAFLGKELVSRLTHEWAQVDRLDIWQFDTFGKTCCCKECQKLGNDTDKALHLLSALREELNLILPNVKLVACAYEGTCTISAPSRPIPQNLLEAGDMVVFYPIMRCYHHDFHTEEPCPENHAFDKHLTDWASLKPGLPIVMGEYYNVSKFEDLPLVFTKRMARDLPYYHLRGVRSITYMHLPMCNWAVRTLNQVLYAALSWDVRADAEAIAKEYWELFYESFAGKMQKVYECLEEGFAHCANLRAWSGKSILTMLLKWDGKKPEGPLPLDDHYADWDDLLCCVREEEALVREAFEKVRGVRREFQAQSGAGKLDLYKTPSELNALLAQQDQVGFRIDEDYRLIRYGYDVARLTRGVLEYYTALFKGADTEKVWAEIEGLEEEMASYYVLLTYNAQQTTLTCRDALTRSQLGVVIKRCREARREK